MYQHNPVVECEPMMITSRQSLDLIEQVRILVFYSYISFNLLLLSQLIHRLRQYPRFLMNKLDQLLFRASIQ